MSQTIVKFKTLSQIGLVFSAYLYAVGFLIVNSHFGLYGIFPESFINARYLSAALLFLFSICVFLAALVATKFGRPKGSGIDLKRYLLAVLAIYTIWVSIFRAHAFKEVFFTSPILLLALNLAIVLLLLTPCVVYAKRKNKTNYSTLLVPHIVFAGICLTPAFFWFILFNSLTARAIEILSGYMGTTVMTPEIISRKRLIMSLTATVIFVNVIGFGAMVYPVVPPGLGGGKAAAVSILLVSPREDATNLGISVGENGWSEDLKLLFKGTQSIYVERRHPAKYACTEIRNDDIKAIRYTGDYRLTLPELAAHAFKATD